ncbi:hypothetical protein ACJX0J_014762, partial [Zea mays]
VVYNTQKREKLQKIAYLTARAHILGYAHYIIGKMNLWVQLGCHLSIVLLVFCAMDRLLDV